MWFRGSRVQIPPSRFIASVALTYGGFGRRLSFRSPSQLIPKALRRYLPIYQSAIALDLAHRGVSSLGLGYEWYEAGVRIASRVRRWETKESALTHARSPFLVTGKQVLGFS